MGKKLIDLTGRVFGRRRVVAFGGVVVCGKRGSRVTFWICECSCGSPSQRVAAGRLMSGCGLSCGCLQRERTSEVKRMHGEGGTTPEYNAWAGLKGRCRNPNDQHADRYGERGIYVCARWLADYRNFLEDMGRRPSPKHSIDRIDNDGPYACGRCDDCMARGITKPNCRWATKNEQMRNQERTTFVEYGGERLPLVTWAERLGIKPATLAQRLRRGRSVEDAFRLCDLRCHMVQG